MARRTPGEAAAGATTARIHGDDRTDPPAPARQRQPHDRPDRVGADAFVRPEAGGEELFAVVHHPLSDLLERRAEFGCRAPGW